MRMRTKCFHVETVNGEIYGVTATGKTEARALIAARLAEYGWDDAPSVARYVAMWEYPFGTTIHYGRA